MFAFMAQKMVSVDLQESCSEPFEASEGVPVARQESKNEQLEVENKIKHQWICKKVRQSATVRHDAPVYNAPEAGFYIGLLQTAQNRVRTPWIWTRIRQ